MSKSKSDYSDAGCCFGASLAACRIASSFCTIESSVGPSSFSSYKKKSFWIWHWLTLESSGWHLSFASPLSILDSEDSADFSTIGTSSSANIRPEQLSKTGICHMTCLWSLEAGTEVGWQLVVLAPISTSISEFFSTSPGLLSLLCAGILSCSSLREIPSRDWSSMPRGILAFSWLRKAQSIQLNCPEVTCFQDVMYIPRCSCTNVSLRLALKLKNTRLSLQSLLPTVPGFLFILLGVCMFPCHARASLWCLASSPPDNVTLGPALSDTCQRISSTGHTAN